MNLKLGMPYMGNKRKLASRIVDKILLDNPNIKYVYDLFGGGGSISFEFLQRPQIERVVYNELNKGVVALLKDIKENGVTDKYFQWVDRETFMKHKGDDDWFGGLCKVVWSFGNNQKGYLFGKEEGLEEYKKNFHLVVVNSENKLKEMEDYCVNFVFDKYGIKQELKLTMPISKDYQKRRLEIRSQLNVFEKNCKLSQLRKLQQLQQLERLQQLQQLERLQQLEISNLSYEGVPINTPVDETIIYLDPPYINTAKYAEDLSHDKLYEWIKKSPYKIYLSSYESNLDCVAEFKHRQTLSGAKTGGETLEKLFVNRQ